MNKLHVEPEPTNTWCAYYDPEPGSLVGRGNTREEAVTDLLEQTDEKWSEAVAQRNQARKELAASGSYAEQLKAALKSAACPVLGCVDGSIRNTGPDPQDDACEWCYGRHLLLEEWDKSAHNPANYPPDDEPRRALETALEVLEAEAAGIHHQRNVECAITGVRAALVHLSIPSADCPKCGRSKADHGPTSSVCPEQYGVGNSEPPITATEIQQRNERQP